MSYKIVATLALDIIVSNFIRASLLCEIFIISKRFIFLSFADVEKFILYDYSCQKKLEHTVIVISVSHLSVR